MKLSPVATSFGAVLALAAVTAPANAGTAAGEVGGARDYGDAADGRRAGYQTRPGVDGRFPARRRSGGSSHTEIGRLRLGDRVTGERDSRQVDLDIADDGFVATLAPCRLSRLTFLVDASRLPAADRRRGNTIYLNAWLDWNRDGDWRDSDRCGRARVPEWRVVNRAIDLGPFRREPRQAIQIDVIAGAQTIELWSRASVTFEERYERRVRASGAGGSFVNDGRGTFRLGETEDRLVPHEDVVANSGCGFEFSVGNMTFTQHDWGPRDVLFGRPAHKLTDGLLGINGLRPATAQLLPSNTPAGVLVRLTPGQPDHDFEVLYLEDGPPRTQIARPRFRITSADGKVAIVTCVIFIDHGRFTARGGGPGGPGSFPPGFELPGGRLPGTPPPGTNPLPPAPPGTPGPPASQAKEVIVNWPIQCAGPNQTILNQRRVDIPANAVNATHELLELGSDSPALPPFCPGGPEMHFPGQVLQPGQGSPPATPGPGNNSYQASMRSMDAGGGTKTVRLRVRWTEP